ncbi:helix-turn-helix domain-containing protein [Candidatus Saccharibacteria bacterium]|nr:helix-turn-helix domain-containing protein [Candidatus Saccharibacteria bacterium]
MNTNKKIGRLIQQVRQQRGLTQAQLAKMMSTSQSAINRIEHGKQNLSLETVKRFSQVLQQALVNFNEKNISLRINGGRKLAGEATVDSAKNTTLALMFAALLNGGRTTLKGASRVEEIFRIIEVFESIGVNVRWVGDDLEIKRPARFDIGNIDDEACMKTRSAMMLIGPLAGEIRKFTIPFSGGCRLGKRSINAHAYALEEMGVNINTTDDFYQINSRLRKATRPITMYESGDTATINVILAAARVEGPTLLRMASSNYQVQDVCVFLKQLGINAKWLDSSILMIEGRGKLVKKDIDYWPAEDPVKAMTLIAAAITTDSEITVKRAPLDFLELELLKINKMGCKTEILKEYKGRNRQLRLGDVLIRRHGGNLTALEDKISCRPYPGINIDHLPYFVPIAATASGTTLIHDWVYENRAIYYTELNRIGADVQLADPHRVYVHGPTKWHAADLSCPPAIRPATVNLIGMLAAPGMSTLRNIYTINRGYENIAKTFNDLGADIEIIKDI